MPISRSRCFYKASLRSLRCQPFAKLALNIHTKCSTQSNNVWRTLCWTSVFQLDLTPCVDSIRLCVCLIHGIFQLMQLSLGHSLQSAARSLPFISVILWCFGKERSVCLLPSGQCKTESRGSKTFYSGLSFRHLECCLRCLPQPKLEVSQWLSTVLFFLLFFFYSEYTDFVRCALYIWLNISFRVWFLQDHGQQRW